MPIARERRGPEHGAEREMKGAGERAELLRRNEIRPAAVRPIWPQRPEGLAHRERGDQRQQRAESSVEQRSYRCSRRGDVIAAVADQSVSLVRGKHGRPRP